MNHSSTLCLRAIVLLMGIAVLALCLFVLPDGIRSNHVGGYRPILIGMYIPAVPFFIGLYQVLKLLNYIDKHNAFSQDSVKALRILKYCGFTVSALYLLGLPYISIIAQQDDAPGVILIGLVFTFAPLIIAVFAALLQKMFQNAIDIKSENNLTV